MTEPRTSERGTWVLVVRLLAEDENDARSKFVEDVPFMLMNDFTEAGNTRLTLIGPNDA